MADILCIGSRINIQRSDGRIHSAIVAEININREMAKVEWFEQNETKGKDVDFAAIESLNPTIKTRMDNNHINNADHFQSQHLMRTASQQSLHGLNMRQTNGSIRSTGAIPRRSVVPMRNVENNTNDAPVVSSNRTTVGVVNVTRRANVVKEVDQIKKNRDERRQRQAEEKAEKEAFLQMAPGNPHWELLNMINEYRRGLDVRPLSESDAVEDHLITVCVRKRPMNRKEAAKKEVDVITIPSKNQLIVHEPKNKVDLTKYLENQMFRFDYAFDETCTNELVYRYTAQPLIKTIYEGGFATCFAYGQTGSGKTHTMGGEFVGKVQDCNRGIYVLAASDVFKFAKSPKYNQLRPIITASFFEIYSGKVFDLLHNKAKLRILEDGKQQVQVVGLTEKVVSSTEEVLKLIQRGNQARTSGTTSANSNSSRSHAVFQIMIRAGNTPEKIYGKFSLIDLAGNERGADTSSANRQTRMEGAEINKSLLALKECIRALGRKGAHLPFRVSKLTQVLRDSFVAPNSRTCMIAMVSPSVASCEHTLNTLRYADRVKELGVGDLNTNQGEFIEAQIEDTEDLLQLRSLNENDMTPEMLHFHQIVSDFQKSEEKMLESHKQTIDWVKKYMQKLETLQTSADDVLFDPEEYCKAWVKFIGESKPIFERAEMHLQDFKTKMAAEEQLSRKMKRK